MKKYLTNKNGLNDHYKTFLCLCRNIYCVFVDILNH